MSNNLTIYRTGTANTYDNARQNLTTRQNVLSNLQENLTSGKRVIRPSDDPVAAAQAERALTRINRIQTEQKALEVQRGAVAQAESALGEAIDLVQGIRDLTVSAGVGSLKDEDRRTIAGQIQNLRDQLTSIANRKDTNGMPLLGALGSTLTPFLGPLAGSPSYTFAGQPGQNGSTGSTIPLTLDGHSAFMFDPQRDGVYTATISPRGAGSTMTTGAVTTDHRDVLDGASYALKIDTVTMDPVNGNSVTYTLTKTDKNGAISTSTGTAGPATNGNPISIQIQESGQTVMSFDLKGHPAVNDTVSLKPSQGVFDTIDSLANSLRTPNDAYGTTQAVTQALANIDSGLERLRNMRGFAGELLNRADHIMGDQENRAILLEGDRSRAEDLDMMKGISDFQTAKLGYEAALQSYAQVQKLSLFNFIG